MPVFERLGRPFTHYFIVIKRRDEGATVVKHIGGEPQVKVKFRGNTYLVRRRKAFKMKGWDPIRRKDFFSTFFDVMPYNKTGFFIFEEPPGISDTPIESLDRISNTRIVARQTPYIIRILARSKLFSRWIKRANFGTGVNMKFVAVMLVVILALVLILWLGGFYGR